MTDDEIVQQIQLLRTLLTDSESSVAAGSMRDRVRALIPAQRQLRMIGTAFVPGMEAASARARILAYFRANVGVVLDGEELMVVAGISEYARRVRELRVQEGWPIASGVTFREMVDDEGLGDVDLVAIDNMSPNQYILLMDKQDQTAADRWRLMKSIRSSEGSIKDKLLRYFRANVGKAIPMEELRDVSGNKSEWARRTRELRTEDAWPILTRSSGDPDLPVGFYRLARDQQGEPHDRHIPELTRRAVLRRDRAQCRWKGCGWPVGFPKSDRRYLEVHHILGHVHGGTADLENLVTLCNLHHHEVHRSGTLLLDD